MRIEHIDGPSPTTLRYLDCEDRPIVRFPESPLEAMLRQSPDGFITKGYFSDGRAWAVSALLFGRARLHVWTPGKTVEGTSDLTFDYHHAAGATIAALDWEGIGAEPLWWHRCRQTGRRRYYQSDGSFREEAKE